MLFLLYGSAVTAEIQVAAFLSLSTKEENLAHQPCHCLSHSYLDVLHNDGKKGHHLRLGELASFGDLWRCAYFCSLVPQFVKQTLYLRWNGTHKTLGTMHLL